MKANSFSLRDAKVKVIALIAVLVVALGIGLMACTADDVCKECTNPETGISEEFCGSEADAAETLLGYKCK